MKIFLIKVLDRLKSPVVIIQILGTIAGVIIFFLPDQTETVKVVVGALVAIINIFAGLNNPTDSAGF